MANPKIKYAKQKNGEVFYPRTIAKAMLFEDGENLETKCGELLAPDVITKVYYDSEKKALVFKKRKGLQEGDSTGSNSSLENSDNLIGIGTEFPVGEDKPLYFIKTDESEGGNDSSEEVGETYYSITNSLNYCINSNSNTSIKENESYVASLTATDGYVLGTPVITMGGVDITSDVYSNGTINIPSVTGNIVITCTSTKQATSITLQSSYSTNNNTTEDFDIKNSKTIVFTNNGDNVINYINVNFDTENYGRISRILGSSDSPLSLNNGDSYTITVSNVQSISLAIGQGSISVSGQESPFTIVVSY